MAADSGNLGGVILAICVPFLNEHDYLPEFLASLAAQTRQPDRLLLVDDGSSDGSHEVAAEFAASHPWATLVRRPPRSPERDRLATAKELEAFQWAVGQLDLEWDVIAKLDADLRLTPRTIETLLAELERDERLGLAGSYLQEEGQRIRIGEGHVHGATKFFRRACFEQISPVPPILGWDTIDEFTARMRGWRTQSFAMPDGDPEHLRPRGTYDGLAARIPALGPVLVRARRVADPRRALHAEADGDRAARVAGGASYAAGYAGAAIRRVPRAAPDVRASVRTRAKAEDQDPNPAHPLERGPAHTNVHAAGRRKRAARRTTADTTSHGRPTRLALGDVAAAAALLALAAAATPASAADEDAVLFRPAETSKEVVTFRVHGVHPRQVLRASLVRDGKERRRIGRERARRVARRGVLRVPTHPARADRKHHLWVRRMARASVRLKVEEADTQPPETRIASGPDARTDSSEATFSFGADERRAAFECRVDAFDWRSCTSPITYTEVPAGEHTFSVRARDRRGSVDPTPAFRLWTVGEPGSEDPGARFPRRGDPTPAGRDARAAARPERPERAPVRQLHRPGWRDHEPLRLLVGRQDGLPR